MGGVWVSSFLKISRPLFSSIPREDEEAVCCSYGYAARNPSLVMTFSLRTILASSLSLHMKHCTRLNHDASLFQIRHVSFIFLTLPFLGRPRRIVFPTLSSDFHLLFYLIVSFSSISQLDGWVLSLDPRKDAKVNERGA